MHLPNNTLLQGGKYKITRFIASGGFGCTYEAVHVMLGKRVAIKELFVKDVSDRDENTLTISAFSTNKSALLNKVKRKFLEEASALMSMTHPNIVKVFDAFEENGTAYYVMDYIDGISLHNMVKRDGKIPEHKAVKYIQQVAEALKYVHGRNRLHLDIKPSNIIVDQNDNAILIDFGVSKQYDEANGESTSTVLGKAPGYSPIEQLGNNIHQFTPATDIYALGATLYKCVTGNTPPDATTVLTDGLPTLPTGLKDTTKKAIQESMRPKLTDRPKTIAKFLDCFNKDQQSPHKEPKPRKLPSLKVLAAVTISALVLVGCIFGYKSFSESKEYEPQEAVEVAEAVIEPVEEAIENFPEWDVSGVINGHDYVNLGLTVRWATCNIGASNASDYGNYYAWGETSTKSSYDYGKSEWYGVSYEDLQSRGVIGSNGNLRPQYDTARQKWGGSWRMPTKGEIDELCNRCTWKWTTEGGRNGYKVTGPNGNSIFLPAAGYRSSSGLYNAGAYGYYWSAAADGNDDSAYSLYFDSSGHVWYDDYRNIGHSIRPVTE